MNIINYQNQEVPKKELPQLIKQSSTYKMIIPRKVEEKIRYLCRKFPTLEWSGVLFTSHKGSFENKDLVITCEDIYPMDLGSPGYTEYKMDETVAGYMADNIELFDCELGLIHSHNQMSCFFSGTDTSTLQSEGNEKNCFVSLIVNNAGTYCAAVTRKIQTKNEVTIKSLGTSYEFFGEGAIITGEDSMSETTKVIDKEIIQYFMLDIEKEEAPNHLSWLDTRFDEIQKKKEAKKAATTSITNSNSRWLSENLNWAGKTIDKTIDKDEEFYDWIHKKDKEEKKPYSIEEQSIWDKEDIDAMTDYTKWQPDPTIIHYLCCQLLTCSLIVNKDIDLKQWISRHMVKKYDEIFAIEKAISFDSWAEAYIEFMMDMYYDEDTPTELLDQWDLLHSKIAEALIDEIDSYPYNVYISKYVDLLSNYVMIE